MTHRIKYPRTRPSPRTAAMKAMQAWRQKRDIRSPTGGVFRCAPKTRLFPVIAAVAARWLGGRRVGGHLGKALRGVVAVYAPSAPAPGAFSFLLRSIKRPWGSKLTIGIRMKW